VPAAVSDFLKICEWNSASSDSGSVADLNFSKLKFQRQI
jgi:hypothetical protein